MSGFQVIGYIDAGSGSAFLAALAGGAAGIWLLLSSKAQRVWRSIRGNRVESDD